MQKKAKNKRNTKLKRKETFVLNRHGEKKKWTFKQWTEKEHTDYVKAVRKHGKDFDKIMRDVKTKTRRQIFGHTEALCKSIRAKKNHPDAEILPILEQPLQKYFSKKEHELYVKGVKQYGKNYSMI